MSEHTPVSDLMKAADICETAADVLISRGWVKGAFYAHDGETGARYCAIGAMRRARKLLNYHPIILQRAIDEAAHRAGGGGAHAIPVFNDTKETTFGDVTDLLMNTAKDLRNIVSRASGERPA